MGADEEESNVDIVLCVQISKAVFTFVIGWFQNSLVALQTLGREEEVAGEVNERTGLLGAGV